MIWLLAFVAVWVTVNVALTVALLILYLRDRAKTNTTVELTVPAGWSIKEGRWL